MKRFPAEAVAAAALQHANIVPIHEVGFSAGQDFIARDLVSLPRSNVVLALALTSAGDRLILTGRVLDKANQNAVLHGHTVADTPAVDPTLTRLGFLARKGFDLDGFAPDLSVAPSQGSEVRRRD